MVASREIKLSLGGWGDFRFNLSGCRVIHNTQLYPTESSRVDDDDVLRECRDEYDVIQQQQELYVHPDDKEE